ncbi:phage tail tape measure protein [Pirellulaceae bacterium SH449]
MSQVKAGAAYVELSTRNAQLLKGLKQAQKQLQSFGQATRLLGTRLMGLGSAAAAPMAGSMAVFASFDDAIRGVRAITQATEADFEALRNKAKQLGATTSYSATEVAELMAELGRAGFRPDQILTMTGAVMDLARATGTDATRASGIMAASIRQFGLAGEDATRVADALTAAANKSFNTVESLGEALKYAAPIAADANMSLEETLAILGSLGNMGIQGSDAGSSLRRLLTLSTAEAERFQKEFGVATTDAVGNVRPLVDILGDVAKATNQLPSGERGAKFARVFGMLGITSASAIGKSVADTRVLYEELKNAGGTASRTAKEMESGIGGSFRILKSSLEGVAIAIGESLSGSLQRMTDAVSGTLSGLIAWIEKNQQVVKTAAKVTLAILAIGATLVGVGLMFSILGSVIGGFLTTIGFVSGILTSLGILMAALVSPIGLVSLAVLGLGGYLLYASGIGAQALAWLAQRFETLRSDVSTAMGAIGKALTAGDLAAAAKILWLTLKLEWMRGIQALTGYWVAFQDSMLSVTDALTYGMAQGMSDGWAGIEVAWVETIGFLADAWSLFTGTLTKTWHSTVGFIKKAWTRLKGLFDSDIDVNAEVQRIDQETSSLNANADQDMLSAIGQRDQDRKNRRSQIESERQGRADALEQAKQAEAANRQQQGQSAIDAAAQELELAKREWRQAIEDLNTEESKEPPTSPLVPSIAALKQTLAASGDVVSGEKQAAEAKSTFNAFAIRGLGADRLSDRQLQAAEQTAANTRKLIQVVEDSRLSYS